MYEQYLDLINQYKKKELLKFKQIYQEPKYQSLLPKLAILQKSIKLSETAIKDDGILFNQLSLLTRLLKSHNYINGQFSYFLNIYEVFEYKNQFHSQLTYFIKPRTQSLTSLSIKILKKIWDVIVELEEYQIFVFNLGKQNFMEDDNHKFFIFDIGNLVILKLNQPIKKQKQKQSKSKLNKRKRVQQNFEIIQKLISNSKQIIESKMFKKFIKQTIDNNFSEQSKVNLSTLCYLQRRQFLKLVKYFVESLQSTVQIHKQELLLSLNNLLSIDFGKQFIKTIIDEQIKTHLDQSIKIITTRSNCLSISQYYQYPLTYNFNNYTYEEQSILLHICRRLLDDDRVNIDLMDGSFQCIFDPRDFLYLGQDIHCLFGKQILEEENLLSDCQNSKELRQILKSSQDQITSIWNKYKKQSCKFDISYLSSKRNTQNSHFLYLKYNQYKRQSKKDNKNNCNIHNLGLNYYCKCKLNQFLSQCCFYCLQSKHKDHISHCKQHNQPLCYKYYYYLPNQEQQSIESEGNQEQQGYCQYQEEIKQKQLWLQYQFYACQICKSQQIDSQINYIRICATHRLPLQYFCFSLTCPLQSYNCIECIRNSNHNDHRHQIQLINHNTNYQSKEPDKQMDRQKIKRNQEKIYNVLSAQKFIKYNQIYMEKIQLIIIFLDQIKNYSHSYAQIQQAIKRLIQSHDDNRSHNDILRVKIKKYLSQFSKQNLQQMCEYFEDKIEQFSKNVFLQVDNALSQFQKKVNNLIFNQNLYQKAEQYLQNKYEVIINTRNSKMQTFMYPCGFTEQNIKQYHYDKIRKVVIDQVVQEESQNINQYYRKQIKQKWAQFYNSCDYSKYFKILEKVQILRQNGSLYQTNQIQQQIVTLKQKMNQVGIKQKRQIQNEIETLKYHTNGQRLYSQIYKIEEKVKQQIVSSFQSKNYNAKANKPI